MKRNQSQGAALAQYGIVIALIALGCFIAYSLLGKTIMDQLNAFLNVQEYNNSIIAQNAKDLTSTTTSASTPAAGSLGGTPSVPIEDCTGSTCTVDYGDFILSGIPENYEEFVEAQGTSGGTDKLVFIINQMADQLEEDGKPAEAQELRNFANLLAFMSDMEEVVSNEANTCSADANPKACFATALDDYQVSSIPQELIDEGILSNYTSTSLSTGAFYEGIGTFLDIGGGVALYNDNSDSEDRYLSSAISSLYDDIQNNPAYSTEMKDVITKTYTTASALGQNNVELVNHSIGDTYELYDLTGNYVGEEPIDLSVTLNTVQHPPASDNPTLNIP